MRRNNLPEDWDAKQHQLFGMGDFGNVMGQLISELEKMGDPSYWQSVIKHMNHHIKINETDNEYVVNIVMSGIDQANDIEARLIDGMLHLKRTIQLETKKDEEYGATQQFFYEHYEQMVPLAAPVRWNERKISARKGNWTLMIPKHNTDIRKI